MGERDKGVTRWELPPVLLESTFSDDRSLWKFRFLVGGANHSWGPTELLPASNAMESSTVIPIFLNFLAAGLVRPFSHFFMAVLEYFQILVLHLHPNSRLVLAIFPNCARGSWE